jgi:hypothetical protein
MPAPAVLLRGTAAPGAHLAPSRFTASCGNVSHSSSFARAGATTSSAKRRTFGSSDLIRARPVNISMRGLRRRAARAVDGPGAGAQCAWVREAARPYRNPPPPATRGRPAITARQRIPLRRGLACPRARRAAHGVRPGSDERATRCRVGPRQPARRLLRACRVRSPEQPAIESSTSRAAKTMRFVMVWPPRARRVPGPHARHRPRFVGAVQHLERGARDTAPRLLPRVGVSAAREFVARHHDALRIGEIDRELERRAGLARVGVAGCGRRGDDGEPARGAVVGGSRPRRRVRRLLLVLRDHHRRRQPDGDVQGPGRIGVRQVHEAEMVPTLAGALPRLAVAPLPHQLGGVELLLERVHEHVATRRVSGRAGERLERDHDRRALCRPRPARAQEQQQTPPRIRTSACSSSLQLPRHHGLERCALDQPAPELTRAREQFRGAPCPGRYRHVATPGFPPILPPPT